MAEFKTEPLATALLLTVYESITGEPRHIALPWGIVGSLGDRLQMDWLEHWAADLPSSVRDIPWIERPAL